MKRDILIGQYRDLIKKAVLESETEMKTSMDIRKLNSKLNVIYKAAQFDGLNDTVITELIDQAIPSRPAVYAA